jgi:hypothetical protein
MRRFAALLLAAALVAVLGAAPVSAAQPAMERETVHEIGIPDEFLTEACGFDVSFDVTGHITFRAFLDAEGNPVREVNNYALQARYYSDEGSVSVRDVGVDRVKYTEDGLINVIVGNVQSIQLPGEGRVYSDVGQITLQFTFTEGAPIVEVLGSAGQHDDNSTEVLCGALD